MAAVASRQSEKLNKTTTIIAVTTTQPNRLGARRKLSTEWSPTASALLAMACLSVALIPGVDR